MISALFLNFLPISKNIQILKKEQERINYHSCSLVGVSGFEPEASWTRTKRDTKLRHTPLAFVL